MMRRARKLRRRLRAHRRALTLAVTLLVAVAAVAGGIALVPLRAPSEASAERYDELLAARAQRADVRGEPPAPSVLDRSVPPSATPVARFEAPVARMRIAAIGVDAEVVPLGLLPDGTMDSPKGPDPVGWYTFTGKPGLGGNGVFSGHLDYVGRGPAVFWDLNKLREGDAIEVALSDGTVITYAVTATWVYPVETIPMGDILAPTAEESITLITCAGTFRNGDYSHRLVLRAVKVGVRPPG